MHQSMPPYQDKLRRSSHSLDGELEGPQPNSIALQMNYPLVNAPPPPLQVNQVGSFDGFKKYVFISNIIATLWKMPTMT